MTAELIDELAEVLSDERKSVVENLLDESKRFRAEVIDISESVATLGCDHTRFFETGDEVAYATDGSLKVLGTVSFVGEGFLTVMVHGSHKLDDGYIVEILEVEPLIAYDLQLELLRKIKCGEIPQDKEPVNLFLQKKPVRNLVKRVELEDRRSVNEAFELDESQVNAVEYALSLRDDEFLLVIGPPGTGKTRVIKKMSFEFMKRGEKVLIASHTNRAVDNAIEGLPLDSSLRVGRPEKVLPHLEKYLLSYKARQALGKRLEVLETGIKKAQEEKSKLIKALKEHGKLYEEIESAGVTPRYKQLKEELRVVKARLRGLYTERNEMLKREQERLVLEIPIIGSTLVKSQLYPMNNLSFSTVIIDECSQASITLALLSMVKGRKWILVGDHKQLLPIFRTLKDEVDQESVSVFNHLHNKYDERSLWLRYHYRSNSKIIGFPQRYIYENMIKPVPYCDNIKLKLRDWSFPKGEVLNPDKPVVFIHVEGVGTRDSCGSAYNEEELKVCKELVSIFSRCGVCNDDIGVITPYVAQKKTLMNDIKNIEVNTVDAFQGREKDIIIFSVTATSSLRFASNSNRLNVALTRPRCKLIVIGNGKSIYRERDSLIFHFLEYAYKEKAIYSWSEGRWLII